MRASIVLHLLVGPLLAAWLSGCEGDRSTGSPRSDAGGAPGGDAAGAVTGPADAGRPGMADTDAVPGPDPRPGGADAGPGDPDPPACDAALVLAACAGCHGPARAEGGLDLVSEGLAERLVGVRSTRCPTELRIAPHDPDRSLLLTVVDAERHAAAGFGGADQCSLGLMPPGSTGLPAPAVACVRDFVHRLAAEVPVEPPPAFEAVPVDSYVRKVKTLLTGGAPTDEEVHRVEADPEALAALVEAWVQTPAFEAKLLGFLQTALHQDLVGDLEDQLDRPRGYGPRLRMLQANLAESFARTALRIVKDGRPFTEVLTTRDWEMTTAVALVLSYTDQRAAQRAQKVTVTRTPPAGAPRPVTQEWMVENRTFLYRDLPADCRAPAADRGAGEDRSLDADHLLDFLLGLVRCAGNQPNHRFENPLMRAADFSDWRTVRITNANAERPYVRFYDLPALRAAEELPLRIRRAGYFTTPAFLANYPTNVDNQFRVTANQAIIVALMSTFSPADATPAVAPGALDEAHAEPGTDCHGCHRLLDPIRVSLWDQFSPVYQRSEAVTGLPGGFAFLGHHVEDAVQNPIQLGRVLAGHPRFKTAWVQRLCWWANSQPCDEADPRFRELAEGFEAGGHDLRALIVRLFASPLVTGAEPGDGPEPLVSITRANHLCPLLAERLGDPGICSGLGAALGLIPRDEFSRGDPLPALTNTPSTFHFAAAESLCQRIAQRLVGGPEAGRLIRTDQPEAGLRSLVERLMGLAEGHPRHAPTLALLSEHYTEAAAAQDRAVALRSAAVAACLSPDVMGVGL